MLGGVSYNETILALSINSELGLNIRTLQEAADLGQTTVHRVLV